MNDRVDHESYLLHDSDPELIAGLLNIPYHRSHTGPSELHHEPRTLPPLHQVGQIYFCLLLWTLDYHTKLSYIELLH